MNENNSQVNVSFHHDSVLLEALNRMVKEDDSDRSKFIRRLIMQENYRRIRAAEVRERGGHAPLESEIIPIVQTQG